MNENANTQFTTPENIESIAGAVESIAQSMEVFTRIAAYFAVKSGMPASDLEPPTEG